MIMDAEAGELTEEVGVIPVIVLERYLPTYAGMAESQICQTPR